MDELAHSFENLAYQTRRLRTIQESTKQGADEFDLTEREVLILEIIRDRSYSVMEIGKYLPGVADSTISTDITRLWRDKSLLSKRLDPKNQRMRIVELTSKGKKLLEKLQQTRVERYKSIINFMELDGDEPTILVKVFTRAAAKLEKEIADQEIKLRQGGSGSK